VKVEAHSVGLMADNMLVSGKLVSSMERELILVSKAIRSQVFGKMVKKSSGLIMRLLITTIIERHYRYK